MITGFVIAVAVACGCFTIGHRIERKVNPEKRLNDRETELAFETMKLGKAVENATEEGDIEYVKKCRVRAGRIAKEMELINHERRDLRFSVNVAHENIAGQW